MGLGVRNTKLHFFKVRFKDAFGFTDIAIRQKECSFDFFVSHVFEHTIDVSPTRGLADTSSQLIRADIMDFSRKQMNLWKHPRLTIQDRPVNGAFDAVHAARDVNINVNPLPYRHSFVFYQTLLEQQGSETQGAAHDAPAIQDRNGGLGECVVDVVLETAAPVCFRISNAVNQVSQDFATAAALLDDELGLLKHAT